MAKSKTTTPKPTKSEKEKYLDNFEPAIVGGKLPVETARADYFGYDPTFRGDYYGNDIALISPLRYNNLLALQFRVPN